MPDVARTLDEIRRQRREAMRRYRAKFRPRYEPLTPAEIRRLRQRLGLAQRVLAAKVGVELGTITRWENGRSTPRFLANERLRELQRQAETEGKGS
jgi:DNA-binding transcriptional regulator YiaG